MDQAAEEQCRCGVACDGYGSLETAAGETPVISLVDDVVARQGLLFFDSHCHLQLHPGDADALVARARAARVQGVAVCGVCPGSDWGSVAALADAHPGYVAPQFGLHPWWVLECGRSVADVAELLREQLRLHPSAGVGECGLDKHATADASVQESFFEMQLQLAAELDRCLTVHCVGLWHVLLRILGAHRTRLPKYIVLHSCNHIPSETLKQFNRFENVYYSLSYSANYSSKKFSSVCSLIPPHRLLLETDSPDQFPAAVLPEPRAGKVLRNEPRNIAYICHLLSAPVGLSTADLAALTLSNARRVYSVA